MDESFESEPPNKVTKMTSKLSLKATQADGFYFPPEYDPSNKKHGSLDAFQRKFKELDTDESGTLSTEEVSVMAQWVYRTFSQEAKELAPEAAARQAAKAASRERWLALPACGPMIAPACTCTCGGWVVARSARAGD